MDASPPTGTLVDLARTCAVATGLDRLLAESLPLLTALSNASAALVVRGKIDGYDTIAGTGLGLDASSIGGDLSAARPGTLVPVPVPASWDVGRVAARRLPDGVDVLVLVWTAADEAAGTALDTALDILDSGVARLVAEDRLADLIDRVNSAQQLANMGDYDWHIATDTNRWSDQLYRIYGHEPQSFNASYERFLAHIHADDRERITGIHQDAYATGEPYQMIERIVRPDGETRYLSSNGQVIQDTTGTPVRMRGTCIDITDRVLVEQARERLAARFRDLVEAAPDAILVVDRDGSIVQANARASELLGGRVVAHQLSEVIPGGESAGSAVPANSLDGRDLQVDITTAALDEVDDEGHTAVFLHDAAPRLANEAVAAHLAEARVRRQQALEINDNVMQGLTAATVSMGLGDLDNSAAYLERTLDAARTMMNDWLNPIGGGEVQPGDLVRTAASQLTGTRPAETKAAPAPAHAAGPCRLLIADDYADMRQLLRLQLGALDRFEVVGEAEDGEEAVRLAAALQPHVVLLDLAMPRMDGLEALPLILAAVEGVQVIALSGFDQGALADKVLAAGAVRYVEKGPAMNLAKVLDEVTDAR